MLLFILFYSNNINRSQRRLNMYTSIEIDFDVYKELTIRRKTEEMTNNDVLREMLNLTPAKHSKESLSSVSRDSAGIPWVCKGVTFPHGTEFRAEYGGRMYSAKVEDGALVYDGQRYKAPSPAAKAITGNSVNGWTFWEFKMPGKNDWILMDKFKNKSPKAV
jgi:hypothetical protein